MNRQDFLKIQEERIQASYNEVDDDIKEDLVEALTWAKNLLRDKEGAGHIFELLGTKQGLVACNFCKPEWAGDHTGRGMDTGSEAIVIAVCEYLNGA